MSAICSARPAVSPEADVELLVQKNLGLAVSIALSYRRTAAARGLGADLDDLIQEATLGLLRAAREYNPKRGAFAALAGLCIKNALNHSLRDRKHRPWKSLPVDESGIEIEPHDAAGEAPEQQAVDDEQGAKIDALLRRLPTRERRVVELRFGLRDGRPRSRQEVADELGVGLGRVAQIQASALARMRRAAQAGDEEVTVGDVAAAAG